MTSNDELAGMINRNYGYMENMSKTSIEFRKSINNEMEIVRKEIRENKNCFINQVGEVHKKIDNRFNNVCLPSFTKASDMNAEQEADIKTNKRDITDLKKDLGETKKEQRQDLKNRRKEQKSKSRWKKGYKIAIVTLSIAIIGLVIPLIIAYA
tara:strand:+ start:946 stop:1404 length:459 start_codon:yes stop_codon:yes gene_type:complete